MSSVGHFLLERNLTSVVLLYINPLSTEIAKTIHSARRDNGIRTQYYQTIRLDKIYLFFYIPNF